LRRYLFEKRREHEDLCQYQRNEHQRAKRTCADLIIISLNLLQMFAQIAVKQFYDTEFAHLVDSTAESSCLTLKLHNLSRHFIISDSCYIRFVLPAGYLLYTLSQTNLMRLNSEQIINALLVFLK